MRNAFEGRITAVTSSRGTSCPTLTFFLCYGFTAGDTCVHFEGCAKGTPGDSGAPGSRCAASGGARLCWVKRAAAPCLGRSDDRGGNGRTRNHASDGLAAVAREERRRIYMGSKFVIADPGLCIGCQTCMAGCLLKHSVPGDVPKPRLNLITTLTISAPIVCHHCADAPCVASCPEGALYFDGARVAVKQERCIGCRSCVLACPYGAVEVVSQEGGPSSVALRWKAPPRRPSSSAICATTARAARPAWRPVLLGALWSSTRRSWPTASVSAA